MAGGREAAPVHTDLGHDDRGCEGTDLGYLVKLDGVIERGQVASILA